MAGPAILKVDVIADASKAAADLDHFSRKAGVVGGVVAGVTTAALNAVGAAARGVVSFMGGALEEAEEAAKVGRVTTQLIETTGSAANVTAKQVSKLTTALSNQTGVDDELIQAGTNVMLTFKNVRNEVGKGNQVFDRSQQAALDLSAVLGTDLASANVQLGKALNDPIKGVTSLAKAGVQFTDDQKKMIESLVATGDVLGAQKIILAEVEGQVGGAAEANATASQKMATAWGNLKEQIGTLILPAFTALTDWFINSLFPVITEFADFLAPHISAAFKKVGDVARALFDAISAGFNGEDTKDQLSGFAGVIEDVGYALGKGADKTLQWLRDLGDWCKDNTDIIKTAGKALGAFAAALGTIALASKASSAISGIGSALGPVLGMAAAAGPWGLLAAAIIAVIAAVVWAYFEFEAFRDVVDEVWQTIKAVVEPIIDWFINTALPALTAAFQATADFITDLWEKWGDEIVAIFVAVAELLAAIWDRVKEAWDAIFPIMKGAIEDFIDGVQTLWRQFGDDILRVITVAWDAIKGIVEGALRVIQGVIQMVTGLISGDWSKTWDGIKNVVGGAWEVIKSVLQAALDFFTNAWGAVEELLTEPFRDVERIIRGFLSGLARMVGNIFDNIVDEVESAIDALKDIVNVAIRAYNRIPLAPDIPELATGGTVARTGLAVVHAGEQFSGVGRTFSSGGNVTINVTTTGLGADAPAIQRAVANALRGYTARNGPLDIPVRGVA